MMEGPRIETVPRNQWLAHLKSEDVTAWYHMPRLQRIRFLALMLAPRGYSRGDNSDLATPHDVIRLRRDVYELAVAAAKARAGGRTPSPREQDALEVYVHEYLHCLTDWTPTPQQLEELEHPTTAVAGVRHARRRRYALNAFTGLLRLRWAPAGPAQQAVDWLLIDYATRPGAGSALLRRG